MSLEGCGGDPELLRETSKNLFSISKKLQNIHICIEEADLEKFVRNGFKVYYFDSIDEVIKDLSNKVFDEAYYLDRFESAVVGSRLESCSPIRNIRDVDWFSFKIGVTYADLLAIDTGSLLFLEDGIQTNLASYSEKLYIIASTDRLTRDFLRSFDILHSLNRLFGDRFLLRIVNAPSRTGDIEKKIVFGAHGPKEVDIYLYGGGLGMTNMMLSYLALESYSIELCLRRYGYTLDNFLVTYGGYREAIKLELE